MERNREGLEKRRIKTLDEVIDDFEKACDLEKRCEGCEGCLSQENGCPNDGADVVPDALHYLYEYRSIMHLQEIWQQEAEKCKEVRERFIALCKEYQERINAIEPRNDPLSWDELRQMEGKPVWADTYYSDDGCYLDGGTELEGCAWMPMPKVWRKEKS